METEYKRNTKHCEIQTRKVVRISKKEISLLKDCFCLKGVKTDFMRQFKIPPPTVNRVLQRSQGEERVVNAMKEYCNQNK